MRLVTRVPLSIVSALAAAILVPACGGGGGGGGGGSSNGAPTATPQSVQTPEDTALPITLAGVDPDGDPLSFSISTGPSNGVLSGMPPLVTYTPNPNFNGSDSFTFTASDGVLISPAATIAITVTPVGDYAPLADSQVLVTGVDTPLAMTLTGSDPDGDPVTYSVTTGPSNGSLAGTAPALTYTPGASFAGMDTFSFTTNDGTATSSPSKVFIVVSSFPAGQSITRVSVSSSGTQANNGSSIPIVSADGRWVAFVSAASNLVAGDTNAREDLFVHDRMTGVTTRASASTGGVQGNDNSGQGAISLSADGRYLAFPSYATNLVAGDTNGAGDIFVHDYQTLATIRVSLSATGQQANDHCGAASISADGRYVAFDSLATNLVPGGTNGFTHVHVRDLQTGQVVLASVDSQGIQANGGCFNPVLSADGRYVAYWGNATNLTSQGIQGVFVHDTVTGGTTLAVPAQCFEPAMSPNGRFVSFSTGDPSMVPGDTNALDDVFLSDRRLSITTRVSVDSLGNQANGASDFRTSVSSDGRFVAFRSAASNLVAGDSNGQGDAFVHDRMTGQTIRVSVNSAGVQGNGGSVLYSISATGKYVGFISAASNLVGGDSNGVPDAFVAPNPLAP